jgi:signal transduction histidine kinase
VPLSLWADAGAADSRYLRVVRKTGAITAADLALAVGLFCVKLATLVAGVQQSAGPISYVTLPLWTLPLAWRRVHPARVAVAVAAAALLEVSIGGYRDSIVALACFVIVPYSLAAHHKSRRELLVGVAVFAPAGIVSALAQGGGAVANVAAATFLLAGALLAGLWVRQLRLRAEMLERLGEDRVQTAVAQERARIARDLHDEVAHAMSVIAVQADAAEGALAHDPDLVRTPLVAIRDTARVALGDMRRVLGALGRDDAAPDEASQPGLARLDSLVEVARAGGLSVELLVEGEPRRLPAPLDVAAYRVVQEALTNVRKHSGAQRAKVTLRYRDDLIEVEVVDDGDGSGPGGGNGKGLAGVRERVAILGGHVVAEPGPRGFALRAALPLR